MTTGVLTKPQYRQYMFHHYYRAHLPASGGSANGQVTIEAPLRYVDDSTASAGAAVTHFNSPVSAAQISVHVTNVVTRPGAIANTTLVDIDFTWFCDGAGVVSIEEIIFFGVAQGR